MKPTLSKYLIVFLIFAPIASRVLFAAEVQTNWNWLTFSMDIAKTNFCIGDKIAVSVTVSNVNSEQHMLPWYAGDPCNYGLGHFEITCGTASISCRLTRDLRAQLARYYLTSLKGHEFKTFEADLASGYYLTNSWDYTVHAVGWFDELDNPTNHHDIAITTPPIILSLSPKLKTNSPTK